MVDELCVPKACILGVCVGKGARAGGEGGVEGFSLTPSNQ